VLSISELSTRISALIRGRPRANAEFRGLLAQAHEWTTDRQEALTRVFEIGSYDRFDWYQERGVIIFSSTGKPKVVADLQFVGSISNRTKTWLWSWANDSVDESLTKAAHHVSRIGASRGFERLTVAKWRADEIDGWEMTFIQAMLTTAEGVYRTPKRQGFTFMTLSNVRWATADEWYEPATDA
jgi:hypothetical protein